MTVEARIFRTRLSQARTTSTITNRAGDYVPTSTYLGRRELNWYGNEMVAVKRREQTIVITGTPASDALRRTMRRVALSS